MSTKPQDQAHPIVVPDSLGLGEVREYGLTKREHFAAMAMQGIAANPDPQCCQLDCAAKGIYAASLADALIAALNKEAP